MTNQAELSQAIATVERQISEAKSEVAKKSLNAKLERLKEELKSGAKKGTSTLATLSSARKSVRKLASKDFTALIEKLSAKPEYAFLKGYSKDKLKDDLKRVAKPVGYRFVGGNTKKPTIPQIKKGLKDGTVYYEARPIRSDVSRVVQLGEGGRIDLFEDYENIPANIQEILDKYSDEFGGDGSDMDYKDTANMLKEFEAEGYTFDYGLDNEPFGLRPIGVKLNELRDYEDFDDDKMAKGGGVEDCIDYIKNSESIKNNGYYLHINSLNKYVDSGAKIPKIKPFCLITFNSGGQKNLKAIDTINATLLSSEIAKLLNIDIELARIIVSEQTTRSKRFTMDMLDKIKNNNIIVADRETIVCTNLSKKFEEGGTIDNSYLGRTSIGKSFYGWKATTSTTKQIKGYDWEITTMKRYGGELVSTATGGKSMKQDGYSTFEYSPFEDPNYSLIRSKPKMVNEKAVTKQHEEALKIFIEKMNEMSGKIMATGGRVKTIKEVDILEGRKFVLINGDEIEIIRLFKENGDEDWAEYKYKGKKSENSVNQLKNFINNWRPNKMKHGGSVKAPIKVKKRLEAIRKSIQNENVSYGELAELQNLSQYIDPSDVELREAAGMPEFDNDDEMKYGGKTKSKSTKSIYIETIAGKTGLRTEAIETFVSENNLSDKELLNLVQGIGTRKLESNDLISAVVGIKGNKKISEVVAFAKSDKAFSKMASGGTLEDNLLPPSKTYGENLAKAMEKFDISSNEARKRYGQYTIKQWSELLGEKMENGGEVGDISKSEIPRMQKITKLKGLYGYMPSINAVYYDSKTDKFYFQDFEGDYMEVRNISTLEQLDKFLKENNITLDKKMATGGGVKASEFETKGNTIYINGTKADVKKMYLDYVNNFLTIGSFADHYGISDKQASLIIENGREYAKKDGYYAKGGSIPDNYEGRTSEDIWNSLSKQQKTHFLYDHMSEIEAYKDIDRLPTSEIRKAANSEWSSLDSAIKTKFTVHTREGQYATGGSVGGKKYSYLPNEDISKIVLKSKQVIGKDRILDGAYVKSNGETTHPRLEKLKEQGYLKSYLDTRGTGTKYFQTIVPNKEKKGYWKRYESTSKNSLGTLQNEMLSEEDLISLFEQQKSGSKMAKGGGVDTDLHGKFGDDNPKLVNFDVDDLDEYETMVYNDFSEKIGKARALQILINNVEGDYTQLSPELAEIAEEQVTSDEWDEESNKRYFAKGGGVSPYYGGMSEAEILKATVVYDNGGETLDRYTVFTPDSSVFGMSATGGGFNQYIGDDSEIEKGSHLGKRLKTVPKDIKSAVLNRMKEEFGDGGSMYGEGGSIYENMTEKEFLNQFFGANVFTENPSEYFDIKKLSSSNDAKVENFINELKKDGYSIKKKSYSDFTSVMGVKKMNKMAKGGNTGYTYVPNADIEKIVGKDGKEYGQKVLLDGAYVKDKVRTPKMSRTQFEDGVYAYGAGGNLGKSLYVANSSFFDYNTYDTNLITDTLKAIGAKNIRLERERPNSPEVVVFNGDKAKAREALNSAFDTETILVYEKDWRASKYGEGGEIERNKKNNDWNSMFNFYTKYNATPVSKSNLMKMAYKDTNGVDSAIPQSIANDVDDTFYYVYDYQEKSFGELVDLRKKLKFSNNKVDVTIVIDGDVIHGKNLPAELEGATFHQALAYVFKHDEVEAFDIRPKTKMATGGAIEIQKMKKEKEKMVSELFEKCGVFFAFSDKQFEENKTPLKEGEKYVSIGGGGYLPKGKVKELEEGMEAIERFGKQTVKKKNLVEAEILDELQNHECFYTGDISDVVDLFEGTYTKQQIRDVYNKHREANQEYALGGEITAEEREQALKNSPKLNF